MLYGVTVGTICGVCLIQEALRGSRLHDNQCFKAYSQSLLMLFLKVCSVLRRLLRAAALSTEAANIFNDQSVNIEDNYMLRIQVEFS